MTTHKGLKFGLNYESIASSILKRYYIDRTIIGGIMLLMILGSLLACGDKETDSAEDTAIEAEDTAKAEDTAENEDTAEETE